MILTKRIIPCLDVANGRVVKGLNFESIKDAGDPVQLAEKYSTEGADELVFLDITASSEQRETIKSLVKKVAEVIDIPFTVGGGVKTLQHARDILLNGADKVAINRCNTVGVVSNVDEGPMVHIHLNKYVRIYIILNCANNTRICGWLY